MATMKGLDPGQLRFLRKAVDDDLGSWNMDEIHIDGDLAPLKNFKLPPLGGEAIQDNKAIQKMLTSKIQLTPRADPDACTACGTCFCCQAICLDKAMALQ